MSVYRPLPRTLAPFTVRQVRPTSRCSRTCEFAVRTRGPRVINEAEIQKIFEETEAGVFARDWMQEWALGMPQLVRRRRTEHDSAMEPTGRVWREKFGK